MRAIVCARLVASMASASIACAALEAQTPGPYVTGPGRYVMTMAPLRVGVDPGLCVAVDPTDRRGVWWWEPGQSGCGTRSTGPQVFQADEASVSAAPGGATAVGFRLGTHSAARPFIRVRLLLEGDQMRSLDTGSRSAVRRSPDLAVPEEAPRARPPAS